MTDSFGTYDGRKPKPPYRATAEIADAEDQCPLVSVGGLAADLGILNASEELPVTTDPISDLRMDLHFLGSATWTHTQLEDIGKRALAALKAATAERDELRQRCEILERAARDAREELADEASSAATAWEHGDRLTMSRSNKRVAEIHATLDAAIAGKK